jgi:hypothetical protein
MTHDELLKRIESLAVAWAKPNYNANALRAVVKMHQPYLNYKNQECFCLHCGEDKEYPCLTIQAIEKELQ